MRFYYITDEILDNRSAETVHINEVCKNLALLGNKVRLYAPPTKEFQPSEKYEVDFIAKNKSILSIFFQIKLFFRLWRDVHSEHPDIIYSRHNHLLIVPTLIGNMFHIPVILEVNGRLLEEARHIDHSFKGRILLLLGILQYAESFNIKFSKKLIAVAPGIKDTLIQTYKLNPEKINIILNGVDVDFFKPMESEIARKGLNFETDALYIGYIGSFYTWQGLRYIIKAAQLVLKERPAVKFLILGRGDESDYLVSFVKEANLTESIKILPAIPHDLVPGYINALDICICYPTKFRNGATSPFKVYEYLACGKPVILADIQGMREEFDSVAVYVEPESPEKLAKGLIILIDNKDDRERLGALGRKFVEQEHTWKRVTEQIVELCRSEINPH